MNSRDWRPRQSLKVRYVIFIVFCICACCFFKNWFSKIQWANCRHSRFEPATKAQWWENTSSECKKIRNSFKWNSRNPKPFYLGPKPQVLSQKSNLNPRVHQSPNPSPSGPSGEPAASAKRRSSLRWGDRLFKEATPLQWPTYFAFNVKSCLFDLWTPQIVSLLSPARIFSLGKRGRVVLDGFLMMGSGGLGLKLDFRGEIKGED